MTSLLAVTWKFPFDEEAFLADLDLDFFFLLGLGFYEKEILSTPYFLSNTQKKLSNLAKLQFLNDKIPVTVRRPI